MKVSPAQARSARKWDAEHRAIMNKSASRSHTKKYILKLADEDELKEVQQWLAQRKENEG